MGPADVGSFGPPQAEPAQVFDGGVGELRTTTAGVEDAVSALCFSSLSFFVAAALCAANQFA